MERDNTKYPKRFYRFSKNNKKELKHPKGSIKQCDWCGKFFLKEDGVMGRCTKRCHKMAENMFS